MPVLVTKDEKLSIRKEPVVLDEGDILEQLKVNSRDKGLPKERRQEKFIGTVIRSAPEIQPIGLVDAYNLVLPDSHPEAYTALYSVSMLTQTLAFRSENTLNIPEVVLESAKPTLALIDKYLVPSASTILENKSESFRQFLDQAKNSLNLLKFTGKLNHPVIKDITELLERISKADRKDKNYKDLTFKLYKSLGLKIYSCPARESIAKLKSFN